MRSGEKAEDGKLPLDEQADDLFAEAAAADSPSGSGRDQSKEQRRRFVTSRRPYRGRFARAVPAKEQRVDLAWDATITRTAHLQRGRREHAERQIEAATAAGNDVTPLAFRVRPDELQKRERVVARKRLILFLLDNSGSVVFKLLTLARRMVMASLEKAYLRRDRVAMVGFANDQPKQVFAPTNQIEVAAKTLTDMPKGGYTPLGPAMALCHKTFAKEMEQDDNIQPVLVLLTDGRANMDSTGRPDHAIDEVESAAERLMELSGIEVIFVDTTKPRKNDHPAQRLADFMQTERIEVGTFLHSSAGLEPQLTRFMHLLER